MSLERDMDRFERDVLRKTKRVIKFSIQDIAKEASKVRGRGGRMRVRTGFLRASIQGAVGEIPRGPARPKKKERNSYPNKSIAGQSPAAALVRWNPFGSQSFVVAWTANYAIWREIEDGFLRGAIDNWPQIVSRQIQKQRKR